MYIIHCLVFTLHFIVHILVEANLQHVTCGSVIKLVNSNYNIRLHSHDVKYGSGSGQQSVTGMTDKNDANSYWRVIGKQGTTCKRGQPIKCGSAIRLVHVNTQRNLHSHLFQSPLSNNQEVSAFGEDGFGDTGDNWSVICSTSHWDRDDDVRLKHVDTSKYLSATGQQYGRPIKGQYEISAASSTHNSNWRAAEGAFIKADSGPLNTFHDEL